MRMKTDGPFHITRKWYGQFYMSAEDAKAVHAEINGIHACLGMPQPTEEQKSNGYEDDCFKRRGLDNTIVSAYEGK